MSRGPAKGTGGRPRGTGKAADDRQDVRVMLALTNAEAEALDVRRQSRPRGTVAREALLAWLAG